jgi:acetyltransferase-like isoleucine patch superfamily enzyme
MVGPFVEIQRGVVIGSRCKIQSHSFLCEGVELEDGVFVGHGVMFTNDRLPRSCGSDGAPLGSDGWALERTLVRAGASIGTGAVILPGVEIGAGALIGAGAVVTDSVEAGTIVAGVPARLLRRL